MILQIFLFALVNLLTPDTLYSADQASKLSNFGGQTLMNGYSLEDFKDFEKKWHLVTVRFRKDTNELRWTFANDLAWKSLEEGTIDYPDGAVFAKIGIATTEDPQFPSSAVPLGARRYQIMVRNKSRNAETGGWAYALFDVNGKTFPEDPIATAKACNACHQIVANRGAVFSQAFQFSPNLKGAVFSKNSSFQKLNFAWIATTELDSEAQNLIDKKWKRIRQITNKDIRNNLFQGTLDEVRPSLEREAYEMKAPAILMSTDKKKFSLILPITKDGCKSERAYKSIMTVLSSDRKIDFRSLEYCNP